MDYGALAVVAQNALLSVTDEIGLLDLLSPLVNGALLVLLITNLRARPWGEGRRSSSGGLADPPARLFRGVQETDAIEAELAQNPAIERVYQVNLVDADGVIHASVTKTLHIRRKEAIR